ncbi:MAG: ABC transporter substrate-binding protein [Deltaproteobacteria bacterium]|nr:MAG: ABC transporter substrate-binding protein [Deltaproteobacteria bacterium]
MKNLKNKVSIIVGITLGVFISVSLLVGVPQGFAAEKINYYFATSVQGPLARKMGQMVDRYNKSQNEVKVVASYTGSYAETKIKVSAAVKAGNPPAISMMSANMIHEFVEEDQIEAIGDFLDIPEAEFLNDFWPGVHANASVNGKLYAIPFQNSTPILYVNADHFREVGLDPDNLPENWEELVAAGKKLIKKDGDETTRYGLMLPLASSYGNWILQAFVMSNGGQYFNAEYPGEVYYSSPTTRGALQFWSDLVHKYGIMPKSITSAGQVSTNFFAGRTSMMIVSTGALTNVRNNVKFDYRVGFVPRNVRNAVPVGGASMIIFKGLKPNQRAAAWKFASWITAPKQLAEWSRTSGYFSPRKSSYDLPEMKEFMKAHPDASVALNQLKYTHPWYSTYNTEAVGRPMTNAIQSVILGKQSVGEALTIAQEKADKLLKPYNKSHGYVQE